MLSIPYENFHRFELSAIRDRKRETESEKEREREKKREKEIVLGYYTRVTYYP